MPVLVRFRSAYAGVLLAVATAVAATPPEAAPPPDAAHVAFAESLARDHGLDANVVMATLAKAQYQQSIIDAITRPAEGKPWKDYRPIFLTDKRRLDGIAFYRENRALIDRAAAEHGVPPQIIVAIIGIETSYGRVTGKYRVLDALTTLAFHYPPREKFFRSELEQLFLLDDGRLAYPIDELKGSYAGAMGWGQFMPTSIAKYARDFDGDDRIDLWNSLPDVTASVAAYFRGYGWETGGPVATRAQPDDDARTVMPANSEPVYPVEHGPYEVLAPLGSGGMGEVYRARDTMLGRDVAIKVLPPAFTTDPDRIARFEREARLLASLNHPHIGAIYGLEEADGLRGLILELVEGPTLADRIARGPLALDEALPIAIQIAEALEAAHEKGIIHRDLKPANIILQGARGPTPTRQKTATSSVDSPPRLSDDVNVKVLDFGLAKVDVVGSSLDLSNSPTMMTSTPGMILGTAPYMSPEQANGREADRASDVWAFGCVLYEMLTGRRAFEGETVGEIFAEVLKTEPDWRRLPADTPEGIRRLLRRSLQKDQKLRFRDIRDARLEIDDVKGGTPQTDGVAQASSGGRERFVWASALALVALIAAVLGVRTLRPARTAPEARLEINTPATRDPSLAISPDGLKIVFAARTAGQSQLWLRSLDASSARPLPGTEGASAPFWSPDSRSVGFFADAKLRLMDIDGGSAQTLPPATPAPGGAAWNRDGTIIFSPNPGSPMLRVSAEGGEPSVATRFESPQQRSHSSPQFLPDGRHFLFFVTGNLEARGVYVGELDGLETKRLLAADAPAVFVASGHLLFIREAQLFAQDFDPDQLATRGDPFPVADHVTGATTLSASTAGPLVYRTPSPDSGQRQLVWVDRSGREIDRVVYPDVQSQGPSISRDGRRVAVFRHANGNTDIWSYETGRRAWDRITFDSGDDIFPLWSPDGRSIVFGSRRGEMDLYTKLLSAPPGSGEALLLSTSQPKFPMDWSKDGRFLLYDSFDSKRGTDIWALPLEGDRKPFAVVQTDFNERLGQFSPDGRWIAYQSDKTGRYEIYLRPFPGAGGDSTVSTTGGAQVRWNPNGRELLYIGADDQFMAVQIRFAADGTTVEAGTPVGLFATNVGSTAINTNRQQYAVSPDGQSFVINSVLGEASTSPITVILNWKPKP